MAVATDRAQQAASEFAEVDGNHANHQRTNPNICLIEQRFLVTQEQHIVKSHTLGPIAQIQINVIGPGQR